MKNKMLPIPKHLKHILQPTGESNTEFAVTGKIVCDCGSESFTIGLVGDDSEYKITRVITVAEMGDAYFLIINATCNTCTKMHLIFDKDLHGWNGFVCGGDHKDLPRPIAKPWHCNKCGHPHHALTITIHSQGQQDFIENLEGEFDKDDWTEAFEWITIKTACCACHETNEEWISYETM